MSVRKFNVTMEVDVDIEIDERHLAMLMSDGWQAYYYRFANEEQAIAYVARLLVTDGRLDGLDGHANLSEDWSETTGEHHSWELVWKREATGDAAAPSEPTDEGTAP